jgi:DNA-binding protein H-NS
MAASEVRTDMRAQNFGSLSFDELVSMRLRIDEILINRVESERERLISQLNQLKKIQIAEIPPSAVPTRTKRFYPKVIPKYMNPYNKLEVWSGRGVRPKWVVAALKDGKSLEDLKIARRKGREPASGNRRKRS